MKTPTAARPARVGTWARAAVTAFDRRRDDILVIERPTIPEAAAAVAAARVGEWRARLTAADADDRVAEALADLRIDCPAVAADLAAVARDFLSQFLLPDAQLRVEVHDKAGCPKFHCDNVPTRLVATYHGPGTEYVRVDTPEMIERAPTGALVFLKGHKHPTHADGVHHRSPAPAPGERRLVVVLDS